MATEVKTIFKWSIHWNNKSGAHIVGRTYCKRMTVAYSFKSTVYSMSARQGKTQYTQKSIQFYW